MGTIKVRKPYRPAKFYVRKRRVYAVKARFPMIGGPVSFAWLCTPGTLVFSLGEFKGFYNSENKWVDI